MTLAEQLEAIESNFPTDPAEVVQAAPVLSRINGRVIGLLREHDLIAAACNANDEAQKAA